MAEITEEQELAIEYEKIIAAIYARPHPKPNIAKADKSCFGHRYIDTWGCGTCPLINQCMNTGDVEPILNSNQDQEE